MASADLRQELVCSICLNIYSDPVTLRCGHNFCRVCIDGVLDTQEGSGVYSCPECRAESEERPALEKNRKLCNIAELVRSVPEEETGVLCTYCVHTPVPALKTCLKCESSLCEIHWRTHSKSAEHVFIDPTTSMENRKCSVHKELLKYYCTEDAACICVSCCLIGEHRGHKMESLEVAADKKRRNVLQKLTTKRQETKKRIQSLQERKREGQEKAAHKTEKFTTQFRQIGRQLKELGRTVLCEISRQEEHVSLSLSHLIQQLEIKKDGLSRRINQIEDLKSDPLTVLQEPEESSDTEELCPMAGSEAMAQVEDSDEDDLYDSEMGVDEEGDNNNNNHIHRVGDLDAWLMMGSLHKLVDIIAGINVCFYLQVPTDILLDVKTAGNYLHISGDRKTASESDIQQNHPRKRERFMDYPQVMSSGGFSSGRHYWDVEIRESVFWRVGMCYPSIDRRGDQSLIGNNNKSWCLWRWNNYNLISVIHDNKVIQLPGDTPWDRVRIYLDYEAGQLSFYSLCDPIRHLHTFSSTFTEPLHAALCVYRGCVKISGVPEPERTSQETCNIRRRVR